MATQDDGGIPVFYSHNQEGVRLVELPDEILDSLANGGKISLKSAPAEDVSRTTVPSQAVLCTATKTYSVRQVQTSNSVFILESKSIAPGHDAISRGGLYAVATSTNTIELAPLTSSSPEHTQSLLASLRAQLLVYDYDHTDMSFARTEGMANTKHKIIADMPFSDGECLVQWRQLCAFEQDRCSYLPSASTLRKVWNTMLMSATSQGISLTRPFDTELIWQGVQEEGFPRPLLSAVFENLVVTETFSSSESQCPGLAQDRCVLWLGTLVAKSDDGRRALSKDVPSFLNVWRQQVPEDWADEITPDLFQRLQTDWAGPMAEANLVLAGSATTNATGTTTNTAPKVAGKRDWHERFRKGR